MSHQGWPLFKSHTMCLIPQNVFIVLHATFKSTVGLRSYVEDMQPALESGSVLIFAILRNNHSISHFLQINFLIKTEALTVVNPLLAREGAFKILQALHYL